MPDSNRGELNTSLFVIEVFQKRAKIWTPMLAAHKVFFTLIAARTELPEDTDIYRVKQYMRVESSKRCPTCGDVAAVRGENQGDCKDAWHRA